jgi:hypothetical protein
VKASLYANAEWTLELQGETIIVVACAGEATVIKAKGINPLVWAVPKTSEAGLFSRCTIDGIFG